MPKLFSLDIKVGVHRPCVIVVHQTVGARTKSTEYVHACEL